MGPMARRTLSSVWAKAFERNFAAMTRQALSVGTRAAGQALKMRAEKRKPPAGQGDWIAGLAMGAHGVRRYRLYRPPAVKFGERLPLMVMLHGCGQDAKSFAQATRINRIAARERFLVLYPEQDRLANAQGCWNWFETRSGRAYGEADLIMRAIDQVCLLYAADPARIAVAGLSAGASMAALLVTRHPGRFKAVIMHSGIPPGTAHSTLSARRRDAWPSIREALDGDPWRHDRPLAAVDGHPRQRGPCGLGSQWPGGGTGVVRRGRSQGKQGPRCAARASISDDGDRLQARN